MWMGDPNAKISSQERAKLLKQREQLVQELVTLKSAPLERGDPVVKQNFRNKDIMSLASQIVALDKKLGRS